EQQQRRGRHAGELGAAGQRGDEHAEQTEGEQPTGVPGRPPGQVEFGSGNTGPWIVRDHGRHQPVTARAGSVLGVGTAESSLAITSSEETWRTHSSGRSITRYASAGTATCFMAPGIT